MYCEEQLNAYVKAQTETPRQWFLDATGSLIKPHGKKVIYVYSLTGSVPIAGVKALPILEWISDRHNTATITDIVQNWFQRASCLLEKPDLVTTDFSWALMCTVTSVFNNNSLTEQLNLQ